MFKVLEKPYLWLLLTIVLLAAGLRLYQLGQVPHGLAWDEAAIGYNGYAVITTRRDEWLTRLPVSFRSFGDYKAPLAIYITGVFTTLLGMQAWVVRLPFALAGVMAVLGFVGLSYSWFEWANDKKVRKNSNLTAILALVAGTFLTLSPWHLHFSRIGFESGLTLMWLVWGVWGWWLAQQLSSRWKWLWLLVGVGGAVAAMYTYHSAKIVVPLLFIGISLFYLKQWKKLWLVWLVGGGLGLICLRPLILDTLYGQGATRFHQATLFDKGASPVELAGIILGQFLTHLQPSFLILGQTETLRHGDGRWGVFLPTTLVLILFGVWSGYSWWRQRRDSGWWQIWLLAITWIVAGTLPAALGVDVPHSNRALLALPGWLLLAVLGGYWVVNVIEKSNWNKKIVGSHGEKKLVLKLAVGGWILLEALFFLSYLRYYYTTFARASSTDFSDGYLEAFNWVYPYEKGKDGKPEVEKIIFSSDYGQPYIYALFVRRTNPIFYQGGSLIKYLFVDEINESTLAQPNTIVVASNQDQVPLEKADHLVYGSDGQMRFAIFVNTTPNL